MSSPPTPISQTDTSLKDAAAQTLSEDAISNSESYDDIGDEQHGSLISDSELPPPNLKDMTSDALETIKSKLSAQCEKIKSELWSRQAREKVLQKRKRHVKMPLRKKYKIDRILKTNQTTKSTFEEVSRVTDDASQEAQQWHAKRFEQEQKIMALRAELDHNQRLITVHNKRNKSIRAQIAESRTQYKKIQIKERAAIKKNRDMNKKYKEVRRALKQQALREKTAIQLARKQAELDKIKNIAKELESQAPPVQSSAISV